MVADRVDGGLSGRPGVRALTARALPEIPAGTRDSQGVSDAARLIICVHQLIQRLLRAIQGADGVFTTATKCERLRLGIAEGIKVRREALLERQLELGVVHECPRLVIPLEPEFRS